MADQAKSSEQPKTTNDSEFASKLDKGAHRFLAHVVVHGLTIGRRSAGDFIRHFSPATIMKGLEQRPHLRADILEVTTGVNRKVALKKQALSAGDDVQIALDEGVTTAEEIVGAFHPDDRVRHLDNKKLWSFVIEGDFWNTDPANKKDFERAKEHIAFILERALTDRLIEHADLVEGVSVDKLAECLPRTQLANIIRAALTLGKDKKVFTDEELLRAAAPRVIVEDVSLRHLWETVVVPKIARAHGLDDEPRSAAGDKKDKAAATASAKGNGTKTTGATAKSATAGSGKPTEKATEKVATKDDKVEDPDKTAVRTPPGVATMKKPRDLPEEVEVLQLDDEFEDFTEDGTDPGLRRALSDLSD